MTHIEQMTSLEEFLVVLDELKHKAGEENNLEEDAQQESFALVGFALPIHAPCDYEADDAVEHLVDLRRVTRYGLAVAHEDEAPREISGSAIDLRVHEIAQADKGGCNANTYHEAIHDPEQGGMELGLLRENFAIEQPSGCEQTNGASVASQAALPDLEQTQRVLDIRVAVVDGPAEDLHRFGGDAHIVAVGLHGRQGDIVPLIEPAMAYACADDETDDHPHEKFVGPVGRAVLVFIEFDLYRVGKIDAYRPEQSLPADAAITKMNEDRVDIPDYGSEYEIES